MKSGKRYYRIFTPLLASAAALAIMLSLSCGTKLGRTGGSEESREMYKSSAGIEGAAGMYDYEVAEDRSYQAPAVIQDDSSVRHNTEEYDLIKENEFKAVSENPVSTLSIDVDTASYSNVRRYLNNSQLPPKDAVRIEEMINYFQYDYPQPVGEHPFSITTEVSRSPWNSENRLIHIGIQGKSLDYENLKACNLVFLIDSSGSMSAGNKLPLIKRSLRLLLNELGPKDRIAIVVYAGSAGLVLKSTPASEKDTILAAFDTIESGGSTAGGEGITLAYRIAKENLIKDGNNRVILCTDGDFNVGPSSTSDMVRMIEEKRKDDIYLTICGFGMGNYKDGRMEQISNAGNGNYFYIDSIKEAEKVFVKQMRANMFTIAKDVKIQIEFNPLKVKGYRLIGYENRVLAREDFDNDEKDAGELGAGHTVTALYEIIPAGSKHDINTSGKLKYQDTVIKDETAVSGEILTISMRYKPVKENKSKLITQSVIDTDLELSKTSDNFRFSAAVAGFGMILRDSKFKNNLTPADVIRLAKGSKGRDEEGYRSEFITLVEKYNLLK
ncbi:MAG TPA: VWA domain-containing protein [Spirochaetota bacterium]|nr:VWA domain-containing protein [Spirochaetota bacterium]